MLAFGAGGSVRPICWSGFVLGPVEIQETGLWTPFGESCFWQGLSSC